MEIKHREMTPWVHPDAYVASTAVLSCPVSVGAGSCVLHGTPRHRLVVGNHVLAGLEGAGGFLPFVFDADPAAGRGEQMRTAMRRYTRMLAREHRDDE